MICPKQLVSMDNSQIINGCVAVELIDIHGTPIVDEHDQFAIENTHGTLTEVLDTNNCAKFFLKVSVALTNLQIKVSQITKNTKFQLQFRVYYLLPNVGQQEQIILSRPFIVCSKIKRKRETQDCQ